jgi:transcriptional regulator with XRE-family HTH domain
MSFGSELRALRRARGIKSKAVATAMEWSQAYICRIEADSAPPPSPEKIARIITLLDAPERTARFLELAKISRAKVVIRIGVKADASVRETMLLLGRAYNEDKIDSQVARELRRVLDKCVAA